MRRSVHRYGAHDDQYAELRLASATTARDVAVLIHGGFWHESYDLRLMDDLCDDLVGSGWTTWNIEYRRLPEGGWPATFQDVAEAIDLLAAVAEPERVVAIGHSAGGHLALWASARTHLPQGAPGRRPAIRLDGVVSQAGVNDLERATALRLGNDATAKLLDGPPTALPERYAAASPVRLIPLGLPSLLVHGTADHLVPPELSESFAAQAREAGDAAELVLVEGEGHFEHLEPGSRCWAAVRDWLAALP